MNGQFSKSGMGVGMYVGDVSSGWIVRDFDTNESYHKWREAYAEVCDILPTVQTARGYHVYANVPSEYIPEHLKTKTQWKYEDGELKLHRCYIVLPPSVHPEGHVYKWLPNQDLRVDCCRWECHDFSMLGFDRCWTLAFERPLFTDDTPHSGAELGVLRSNQKQSGIIRSNQVTQVTQEESRHS